MQIDDDMIRHEALHMASFLVQSFDREILENEFIQKDPRLLKAAQEVHDKIFSLYQDIAKQGVS